MHRVIVLVVAAAPAIASPASAQMPLPKQPIHSFTGVYEFYKELQRAIDLDTKGQDQCEAAKYEAAKESFLQALAIKRKYFEDDHPIVATSYTFLSALYLKTGNPVRAEEYSRRFVAAMRVMFPTAKFPMGADALEKALNNHGAILDDLGEYAQAEELLSEALEMRRRLHPKNRDLGLAVTLANLASVLFRRGEFAAAERYARESLDVTKGLIATPETPQQVARAYGNLAETLRVQGKFEEAEKLHRASVEIFRKQFPQGHPSLAWAVRNLSTVLLDRGKNQEALGGFREALAMAEAAFVKQSDGHPQVLQLLRDMGVANAASGHPDKAGAYHRQALEMARTLYPTRTFPNGHPGLSYSLSSLGEWMLGQGNWQDAAPLFREALTIEQNLTARLASLLSEAEALNLLSSRPANLSGLLASTAEQPFDPRDYRFIWQSKASLQRVLERRRLLLLASEDPDARQLAIDLNEARLELARRLLAPATDANVAPIEKLTARKEHLEKLLARKFDLSAHEDREESPEDLQAALPPGHAFVDFLCYLGQDRQSAARENATARFVPYYVAFILTPDRPVVRVELGPAEPIHSAVATWRQAITVTPAADAKQSLLASQVEREAAMTAGRLIWSKVRAQLPERLKAVYLAPDLGLTHVPFVALPGGDPKRVLLEEHAIAVVPHGPYLANRLRGQTASPSTRKGGKVLLVGDVAYDLPPAGNQSKNALVSRATAAVGDKQLQWRKLAFTAQELHRVSGLAIAGLGVDPVARCKDEASVAQILSDLPGTRFAHFATHGFFADPSFRSALQVDERLFASHGRDLGTPGLRSPLVLSGLVLAGANRQNVGNDRGILTAEGIIGLRLEGMELATLSACSTGLGDVAFGEGVFGLTRAFHVAGARNVIASLWDVNDEATAALMGLFYENLWLDKDKLPPLEALRQAQLYIYRNPGQIRELAERRGGFVKVRLPPAPREDPRTRTELWAAFVLSGLGQ
jgi:CHAT domain-containing protein/Tfp pilus assembly protein PilF